MTWLRDFSLIVYTINWYREILETPIPCFPWNLSVSFYFMFEDASNLHCCRTRPLPKGFYEVTVCLVISVNEVLQVTWQPTQKLFISNGFELTWGVLFFGVVPVRPLDRCKFVFDALHNLSRVNNDNIVPFKIINVTSMEREEKGTQLVFLCVLVTEINDTLVCCEEST